MAPIGPRRARVSPTWRYALAGGLVSVPFTVGLHRLSGAGDTFSLSMVLGGGVLAGLLAATADAGVRSGAVGLRAGLVGGLPGAAWAVGRTFEASTALSGPLWFRVAGRSMVVLTATTVAVGLACLVGLVGAKVGAWLAGRAVRRSPPVAGE